MDSLTHVVLGAIVGETVAGKKVGNKALVYGAIAGVIPDFDLIFAPLYNPVDALFVHRGFSHSFIFWLILAPLLAFIVSRIDKDKRLKYADWVMLIAFPWLSHILVDIFNTYGTAIFEPFSNVRVSYDSVAIVDVFLLAVLIPATLIVAFIRKQKSFRRIVAWVSILFLAGYFGLSIFIKENLESTVRKQLLIENISYTRIQTAPLPLTNLMWMVVVEDSLGYSIEQRNLLEPQLAQLKIRLSRNQELLGDLANSYEVKRIIDFTRGFYSVEKNGNDLTIYDLHYSSLAPNYPDAYVLTFNIKNINGQLVINRVHPVRRINVGNIKMYLKRIFANA